MTDGHFSQEVPAFASSDWRKCESSSATQRQCTAGLRYKLQAGAFWLTIWSWSWKLVYHLLCTVCGSAEIFMLNKRGFSKVAVFQQNEGYSNGHDGFTQSHIKVQFQKTYFIFWNLWYFVIGIKCMLWVLTTFTILPPTVIQCFRWNVQSDLNYGLPHYCNKTLLQKHGHSVASVYPC